MCNNIDTMSIIEIEAAISKLPVNEVSALMSWLERYHAQLWDKQIADDLESGRLDSLLSEVEKEYEAGRFNTSITAFQKSR
jgi:hypothetical protein